MTRRIAAVVLPSLVCELARESICQGESDCRSRALAVLLDRDVEADGGIAARQPSSKNAKGADVIDAVDEAAYSSGVRRGQRVTEAMAYSAELAVVHVPLGRVLAALATVAEVALSFGVVAHIEPLDSVWLDVSGVAHLFGGEAQLVVEIEARISALGFRTHVAIADGPRIADALARYKFSKAFSSKALSFKAIAGGAPAEVAGGSSAEVVSVAPPGRGAEALAPLSIGALPLSEEARSLFVRLGVLTVADFARLPRAQVVARLSSLVKKKTADASAAEVMALAMGHDPLPLEPYQAPDVLVEELTFDDGVETAPQLLFVLRGMVSRLSLRLLGRAQATNRIEMTIAYDRSIFRLRTKPAQPCFQASSKQVESDDAAPSVVTIVELPAPLAHEGDLLRAFKAKLEQIVLVAPAVGLRLELSRIVTAPRVQLDLSRDVTVSPDALPALLSELSAEIGASAIGVLSLASSFRPEARSVLVSVAESLRSASRKESIESELAPPSDEPPRLLQRAVSIGHIGSTSYLQTSLQTSSGRPSSFFVGHQPFEIVRSSFDRRLEGIEWWAPEPASRDYLRVLITTPHASGGNSHSRRMPDKPITAEAWIYVNRRTGEGFLQGFWE